MTKSHNSTNDADLPDNIDLLGTLRITRIERRAMPGAGGAWVTGTIRGYRFEALVFPGHAESESYELGDSRISKLWIRDIATGLTEVNFDRGWDVKPRTTETRAIVDLLAAGLAETVFGE